MRAPQSRCSGPTDGQSSGIVQPALFYFDRLSVAVCGSKEAIHRLSPPQPARTHRVHSSEPTVPLLHARQPQAHCHVPPSAWFGTVGRDKCRIDANKCRIGGNKCRIGGNKCRIARKQQGSGEQVGDLLAGEPAQLVVLHGVDCELCIVIARIGGGKRCQGLGHLGARVDGVHMSRFDLV